MINKAISIMLAAVLLTVPGSEEIFLRDNIFATSELVDGGDTFAADSDTFPVNIKYGAGNIYDGDFSTAWVEGSDGPGLNESIYIGIQDNFSKINIFGGYGKNKSVYKNNNRVKKLKLSCYAAIQPDGFVTEVADGYIAKKFPRDYYLELKDVFEVQSFDFPFSEKELISFREKFLNEYRDKKNIPLSHARTILQIQIVEVYKGARFDDTCISEIFFNDKFIYDARGGEFPDFVRIFVDPRNDSRVLIDTSSQKGIAVLEDNNYVYQIGDVSPDKKWASIIRMPAKAVGRVETEYLLINTATGKIVNDIIKTTSGVTLSFFSLSARDGFSVMTYPGGEISLIQGAK